MLDILNVTVVPALINNSHNGTNKCHNVKIIFFYTLVINPACFDLSWSSSGR